MDAILTAIKTALRAAITYVADADIVVVPHLDYIPNGTSFPCITIKDGPILSTPLMGDCNEYEYTVYISAWVTMANDELSLVGSGTTIRGLIDLVKDIESALNNNLLSISGVQDAYCNSSEPSELFGGDRETLSRKTITVTYEKQE